MQLKYRFLILCAVLFCTATSVHAQVFNCSTGFNTGTGACGVAIQSSGTGAPFLVESGNGPAVPSVQGTVVNLMPSGSTHVAQQLNYQTRVNVQAFTTTFTFVPNGTNVSLVIQNSNDSPSFNEQFFNNGAGCEADFYQGFSQTNPPNNVFALEFDQYDFTTPTFYSNVAIYQSNQNNAPYVQCPCVPTNQCGTNSGSVNPANIAKISTSPVALNNSATSQFTTTGDTYSATVTYDGSNFTLSLQDITLNGPVFTHTWTGVNIPASTGQNTAWIGIGASTGLTSNAPLTINSWTFSEGSVAPTPTPTTTATPTATATATPTQTATATLSPTSTPTPTPCTVSIASPTSGSTVTAPVTVSLNESGCGGNFNRLQIVNANGNYHIDFTGTSVVVNDSTLGAWTISDSAWLDNTYVAQIGQSANLGFTVGSGSIPANCMLNADGTYTCTTSTNTLSCTVTQ